jgi:hypothetical protein
MRRARWRVLQARLSVETIDREDSRHRATATATAETGGVVKKAKRKTKAKAPPTATVRALRDVTLFVRQLSSHIDRLDEQMRLWELRIRGSLTQMAGVIAEQQNVPALLKQLATQDVQIRALRVRLGMRREECRQGEIAPEASCQNGTASASSE